MGKLAGGEPRNHSGLAGAGRLRADRQPQLPTVTPPSHKTTDRKSGLCTPGRLGWTTFILRKIILYGESKKSTHEHQNVVPFEPTFADLVKKRANSARPAWARSTEVAGGCGRWERGYPGATLELLYSFPAANKPTTQTYYKLY